jgi:hypothetical protein
MNVGRERKCNHESVSRVSDVSVALMSQHEKRADRGMSFDELREFHRLHD